MDKQTLLESGYLITSNYVPKKAGLFLWGEFMHGDADHYSKELMQIPSVEILDAFVKFLKCLQDSKNYRMEKRGQDVEEYFYSIVGEKWKEEYLYDHFVDWWPHDITCDDYRASLESWWIIFVDEDGHEYKVSKL